MKFVCVVLVAVFTVSTRTQPFNLEGLVAELRRNLPDLAYTYNMKLTGAMRAMFFKQAPFIYSRYLEVNGLEYGLVERKERYKLFEESLKAVLFGDRDWEKGINKFSDRTREERESYLGYNRTRVTSYDSEISTVDPDISETSQTFSDKGVLGWPLYPGDGDTVDWRERGAMTRPLDQGDCGACWAFSSTSVVEALYFIKTGVLRTMSIQQIADCTYTTSGCFGGWYGDAFAYLKQSSKLARSSSYPLSLPAPDRGGVTVNKGCQYHKVRSSESAIFAGYLSISEAAVTPDQITRAVSRHPVSAGIHAPDSLFRYKSGIFKEEGCLNSIGTNNHAVVIAGYTPSTFLLKNSWGEDWGEGGYFRLRRGPYCGVMTDVVWPTLHTYKEEKDPASPDPGPCRDSQPWCAAFSASACPHSAAFRKVCPYSCSSCSCRDTVKGCDPDSCGAGDPALRWRCARTCRLCYCPPGTSLCGTRCLPYWDSGFKQKNCAVNIENDAFEP